MVFGKFSLWSCNFCCSLKSASVVPAFLEVGPYLVIQLKRFVSHDNQVLKDMEHVQCTPNISVPVKENEVTFHKHYHLIATINHTGSLTRGHYTSFIKIPNSKSWLHCNDAAVLRANENKVNNTSLYINFYESHENFFFPHKTLLRGLGFLSLSLGVTTLHITPVRVYFIL